MNTGPWLTAAQLAGLPGVPGSERRTRDWLQRIGVPQRRAAGKRGGGGVEWDCSALPAEPRQALLLRQVEEAAPAVTDLAVTPQLAPDRKLPVPAVATPSRVASRSEAACADARLALLNHAYSLQPGRTLDAAFHLVAHQLATGAAPADMLALVPAANQRARSDGAVSAKTLWKWHAKNQVAGWAGLLPAPVLAKPAAELADDVAAVLARYHSTSGAARNMSHCAQAVNTELGRPHDAWVALAHRARRALPKLPKVDLIKARHTGAERDAKLPYKRRDTGVLAPNDVWLIDGHTFKAKVRHPFHGQPFAPEVTAVIDAADRYIVGWSVSLSENTIAVGDAVRVAVTRAGTVPAMIYSDNGGGETGKMLDCPVAGIYNRLGISHPTGLPGKPQGHGLIESSWRTTMIRCARQYGSYQGGDADSHTVRNVRLELAREATAVKRAAAAADGTVVKLSTKVPGWQQFMADVAAEVERYNTLHRHRSLPKHTSGPHAGKHMTPAEARAAMAQPIDPVLQIDRGTALLLFMPAMVRTPARGWVTLENKKYFSHDLMAHGVDNERCRVHYDIHDPGKVWVWTLAGDFVCEAQLEGNTMDYMPHSALELARHRRTQAAIKRLQTKIDLANAELSPQLDAPAAPVVFAVPQRPADLVAVQRVDQAEPAPDMVATSDRPAFFTDSAGRYEWLMQHPGQWAEGDATWLADYAASDSYAALAGYFDSRGIAWTDEGESPGFNRAG